jgi:uncharacterized protein YqgV (UPF0045/DUF77 family)
MTTLTKEYFDQRLDNTKKEIVEEIHELAAMTAKGFDDVARRLDVRERVDALEQKMKKVESALNVRF